MKKIKIKNKFAFIVVLELIVSLFATFLTPGVSYANTAPTTYSLAPTDGTIYTTSKPGGTAAVWFSGKTIDPDNWDKLKLQVVYHKIGEANWRTYGIKNISTGPNGAPVIANGIKNIYMTDYGLNCAMGWGSIPKPASCDVVWSNGAKSGYPAWSGYAVYFPSVALTAGQYEWEIRGYDNLAYGAFTKILKFTVKDPVVITPPPTPKTPTPTTPTPTTPTPKPKTTVPTKPKNTVASNPSTAVQPGDTSSPSTPSNLYGEFKQEENSVVLIWDASTDNNQVAGYEVERTAKDQNAWTKIGDSTSEDFSDFQFEPQKSYQYRVRAYDQAKNFSDYSNVIEVVTGDFFPNVTVKDGGSINEGLASATFPAGSTDEDLFVTIEKIAKPNIKLAADQKIVGDVFDIKAKNSSGTEITKFKTQITLSLKYDKKSLSGVSESTIKLANLKDDNLESLPTSLSTKNKEAKTLTDHLSVYVLVASKTSAWVTFFKIVLWIIFILALAAGSWYLWILYQRQQYQKEHRDDYIYRS